MRYFKCLAKDRYDAFAEGNVYDENQNGADGSNIKYFVKRWPEDWEEVSDEYPWINVNQKLPEFDGEYLCMVHEIEECKAEYNRRRILDFSFAQFVLDKETQVKVTHWTKLPETPKS